MKTNNALYFIGIKGSGMASLAQICAKLGYEVSGSDTLDHVFTEEGLKALNIPLYKFDENNIKDHMTVVAGNAFFDDHLEVKKALENDTITFYRYHEFLGKIMEDFRTITVSGSHGKTTTTTLLKDMLEKSVSTGFLIGDGHGELTQDDTYFAVEACEFKRHFLAYHPDVAILTNFEMDHVDYFKNEEDYLSSYQEFIANVKEHIIIWGDDPNYDFFKIDIPFWTYGLSDKNDIQAKNIIEHPNSTEFDLYFKGENLKHFDLPIVGEHMVLNTLAVIGVGLYEKVSLEYIEEGLHNFKGAARRYVIQEVKDTVLIDDYAHNPTEIKLTLEVTRRRYPDKKLVAVYKPDRPSRIVYFIEELKDALSVADEVVFLPFPTLDSFESTVGIDVNYLKDRVENSIVIEDTLEGAQTLASLAPGAFVFMSTKNVYDIQEVLKELL